MNLFQSAKNGQQVFSKGMPDTFPTPTPNQVTGAWYARRLDTMFYE